MIKLIYRRLMSLNAALGIAQQKINKFLKSKKNYFSSIQKYSKT